MQTMTTMNRTQSTEDRWQTIRKLWQENQWLYVLVGILIGLVLSQFYTIEVASFVQNLIPEAVGIGFTVLVLDAVYQRRERKQYKERLILEMGSLDNSTALRASEALNRLGWAQDGSLVSAYLREANLKNIRIKRANLHRADLVAVNLMSGEMYHTNFSNVQMSDSDLRYGRFNLSDFSNSALESVDFRQCRLRGCNFNGTTLIGSDFENADLEGADLRGAWLLGANLEGAIFGRSSDGWSSTKMDEETIMPDGKSWYKGIDLDQYLDPYHPEFWRPKRFDPFNKYADNVEIPFWWRRQHQQDGNS